MSARLSWRVALYGLSLLGAAPACDPKCKGGDPPEEECTYEARWQARCGDCADGVWQCVVFQNDELGKWEWSPPGCDCIGEDGRIDDEKCPDGY